ncbi:MAG: hypothetical protein J3R72DRAFT_471850 [Linnemannia gamsii]|nr:MAG: hypothetical protein J3R72DRAFT_471850 [Linnemannia gamsii]
MVMATSTFRSCIIINLISGGLTSADNLTKMAAICIDALKCSHMTFKALAYLLFTTSTKPLELIGPVVTHVLDVARRLSFGASTGTWDIRIFALRQLDELATEFSFGWFDMWGLGEQVKTIINDATSHLQTESSMEMLE